MLDVLSRNANVLLFLHGVLVSNELDTCGLLTISRYIYGLHRFPPACMAIVFEQALTMKRKIFRYALGGTYIGVALY